MQSDLWIAIWPSMTHSVSGIFQIGTAVLSITLISIGVYRVFFHPLSHIPGPPFAKLTHLWQTKSYFTGNWHNDVLQIHEKYGPVVRISPDEISFVDGYALKRLYGHVKPCTKATSFSELTNRRRNGTIRGTFHQRATGYSPLRIKSNMPKCVGWRPMPIPCPPFSRTRERFK